MRWPHRQVQALSGLIVACNDTATSFDAEAAAVLRAWAAHLADLKARRGGRLSGVSACAYALRVPSLSERVR